jgi:hypothetical protein
MNQVLQRLRDAARRDPSICLVDIRDGTVTFTRLQDQERSAEEAAFMDRRVLLARTFLEAVVREHAFAEPIQFGLRLRDRGVHEPDVPIFAFQKRRYESTILLPDLDFVVYDFYEADRFKDSRAFADKKAEGYFVGSTTGGIVTLDGVRAGTHPRVRAARYFRDTPQVTFEISDVVQYDSDATRQEVERLVPLADGRRSWHHQFGFRYLISIDGNGAAWSRPAVALASNSVLVSYASPWLLHYFRGLDPWVHYIPVQADSDVIAVVDNAANAWHRDLAIAEAGVAFADAYLTRSALMSYAAGLLRQYGALFSAA